MAEMGKYCKAYLAKDFRKYPKWTENLENLRKETESKDGEEIELPRGSLDESDILYLQENYVVTDGIMKDEFVIFDQVDDEWQQYCEKDLQFEIPIWEPIEIKPAGDAEASSAGASAEE